MSTASLPSYVAAPNAFRAPSYTAEPHEDEYRLALNDRIRPRPQGEFVKQTRNGDVSLRLVGQEDNIAVPVYGTGASVEGTVEISKTEDIVSVEVKVEGRLKIHEIGEGGAERYRLSLGEKLLWSRGDNGEETCPTAFSFSINLPATFSDGEKTYPLPPSYEAHLSGLPGFTGSIQYSVTALVIKDNLVPKMKSAIFGKDGKWTVSTPFVYYPRTCPAVSLPKAMTPSPADHGFLPSPEWKLFGASLKARHSNVQDIVVKLYLPASRIFCLHQPIPFHLTLSSSAFALATFMPFGPVAGLLSPKKKYTSIQLLRQVTVDVRNAVILGTKTDMWRIDSIGDGSFKHASDGSDWISFNGEIPISDMAHIGGFRASGFSVKDCIVLSMVPPDPTKSPFKELRHVIPVRLVTDPWTPDGAGIGAFDVDYDAPPSEEQLEQPKGYLSPAEE